MDNKRKKKKKTLLVSEKSCLLINQESPLVIIRESLVWFQSNGTQGFRIQSLLQFAESFLMIKPFSYKILPESCRKSRCLFDQNSW